MSYLCSLRRLVGAYGLLLALLTACGAPLQQAQQAVPMEAETMDSIGTPAATITTQVSLLSASPTATPTTMPTSRPTATPAPTITPKPAATPEPTVTPTPPPVTVNGRVYDAYIAAATTEGQAYQYSCEFDAVWVILQTYGIEATVDDIISRMPKDTSREPYYAETPDGFVIYGGDIRTAYSGDYRGNFLARATGSAIAPVFASYGVEATPVQDRAGVEMALREGALIWMKTTVDFQPWRPATWIMPDGTTYQTVLGNDHAVVVMGFNSEVVVIRDVLGPTSSNWQRPYEYEVPWDTFLQVWEAQSFDGLAIAPPHP